MERLAARSVSIETAIRAMQERDLDKLEMLRVWQKKRGKTVLISPDDVSSLGLVDRGSPAKNRRKTHAANALDAIESGRLKASAREVCIEDADWLRRAQIGRGSDRFGTKSPAWHS